MYDYKYCVYLQNKPYIDNYGELFACCKNRKERLPYNIKDMKLIDMYNSPEFVEFRRQMAIGQMPVGCEPCYNAEANGIKESFRVRNLKGLRYRELGRIEDFSKYTTPYSDNKIRALDLRMGSTCNLTCIMCYPSDSNSWHKIFEHYAREVNQESENAINITMDRYQPKNLNWAEDPQAWENIFCSIDQDVKQIYLAGGEPFYMKGFEDYLLELHSRCPQAFIEINTNATRLLPSKYLEKLKDANIGIRVSIDGIGKVDEYIRQGTNWEVKEQVIEQYNNNFSITSFDVTLNSLNIHDLPNIITWIKDRYINSTGFPKILLRPVVNQKGLEIQTLPLYMRNKILQETQSIINNWQNYSRYLNNIEEILNILKMPQSDQIDKLGRIVNFWDEKSSVSYDNQELLEWVNEHSSSAT